MKTAIILTSIIALVCAGFLAGYFLNLQSSTVSDLPENLVITNVDLGTDGSEYWVAITVNNTGISNVNVVKLLFNNVKQSSVSPSLPISLAPDAGAVINATIDVTEKEYQTDALNIDVITSKGNTFSKVFTQSYTIGFVGTEELRITSMTFGTNTITLTCNNTGTTPVTLNEAWVNNVKQSTVSGLGTSISANEGAQIAITYTVVNGNNYQVKLVSSKGNTFMYTAVAPS